MSIGIVVNTKKQAIEEIQDKSEDQWEVIYPTPPDLFMWAINYSRAPEVVLAFIHRDEITHRPQGMWVLKKDTDQDIIDRYLQRYPKEAKAFMGEMADYKKNLNNEIGMSKDKTLRIAFKVPFALQVALETKNPKYFSERKSLRKFKTLMPELAIGKI